MDSNLWQISHSLFDFALIQFKKNTIYNSISELFK